LAAGITLLFAVVDSAVYFGHAYVKHHAVVILKPSTLLAVEVGAAHEIMAARTTHHGSQAAKMGQLFPNHCLFIGGHLTDYSHFTRSGEKHQKQGSGQTKNDDRGNGGKINHET
jgi:hypothetical protein